MTRPILIAFLLLALAGCDAAREHVDDLTCAFLPSYIGDCLDPAVHDKAVSIFTDGIVEAEIECNGIALGPSGKFASVVYKAQKLQDGACFAKVDLFGSSPPTPGFTQSHASELTRRSAPDAEFCPVTSFHVPQLRSDTSVVDGVIRVEGAFCTTTPGSACTLSVASNCIGLNIDRF